MSSRCALRAIALGVAVGACACVVRTGPGPVYRREGPHGSHYHCHDRPEGRICHTHPHGPGHHR